MTEGLPGTDPSANPSAAGETLGWAGEIKEMHWGRMEPKGEINTESTDRGVQRHRSHHELNIISHLGPLGFG